MMKLTETYTSLTQTHIKFDIYQPNVILRYKGIIQLHHGLVQWHFCGLFRIIIKLHCNHQHPALAEIFQWHDMIAFHAFLIHPFSSCYFKITSKNIVCFTLFADNIFFHFILTVYMDKCNSPAGCQQN